MNPRGLAQQISLEPDPDEFLQDVIRECYRGRDGQRLQVTAEAFGHALVNLGPETLRRWGVKKHRSKNLGKFALLAVFLGSLGLLTAVLELLRRL